MPKYTLEELQSTAPTLDPKLRKAYDNHLNTPLWRNKKAKIHRRDGNQCQICGEGRTFDVHHLTYERVFVEKLTDLVLLCTSCHRKVHMGNNEYEEKEDITTALQMGIREYFSVTIQEFK